MGAARLVWLAALALLTAAPARAQPDGLPTEPMLRINAPSHIAKISRIATDAAERFAVTASDDKTVRVWSLPDGTLQRVIWVPRGEGNLGKAYAVALSPDGGTIAVGGRTSPGADENVYLFDRASGALVRRLPGLSDVVLHLAFSPDGRRLAAALGGAKGIRVFDAADGYRPLPSDGDYGGASYWVDFDRTGRLVSASLDGFVRLYAADRYDRPAVPKAGCRASAGPGRSRSHPTTGASLSGIMTARQWRCCATATCGRRPSPRSPAWMPAGSVSLGRRTASSCLPKVITSATGIAWPGAGTRRARVAPSTSLARTILSCSSFRCAAGRCCSPTQKGFGLIDSAGKAKRLQDQGSIDNRYATTSLRISTDARTAQVTDHASGRVLRFAFARRTVAVDPAEDKALVAAVTGSDRIKVTDWEDNVSPKLNGKKLVLRQDEISRSLALVPTTDRFVLGAEWSLRLFDAGGKAVWPKPRAGSRRGLGRQRVGRRQADRRCLRRRHHPLASGQRRCGASGAVHAPGRQALGRMDAARLLRRLRRRRRSDRLAGQSRLRQGARLLPGFAIPATLQPPRRDCARARYARRRRGGGGGR